MCNKLSLHVLLILSVGPVWASAPGDVAPPAPEVGILYYPVSKYPFASHCEILIDGHAWSGLRYSKGHAIEVVRRAARSKGPGFLKISIEMTREERERLTTWLGRHQGIRGGNCSSGSARALRENSTIRLPYIVTVAPSILAAYLASARALGYHRVGRIEWVGRAVPAKFSVTRLMGTPIELFQIGIYTYAAYLCGLQAISSICEKVLGLR